MSKAPPKNPLPGRRKLAEKNREAWARYFADQPLTSRCLRCGREFHGRSDKTIERFRKHRCKGGK